MSVMVNPLRILLRRNLKYGAEDTGLCIVFLYSKLGKRLRWIFLLIFYKSLPFC